MEEMTEVEQAQAEIEEINRQLAQAEMFMASLPALIAEMQQRLDTVTYEVAQISDNLYEVLKKPDEEMPTGDYLNPIRYIQGMSVVTGMWYYLDDKNLPWEAIKTGIPTGFDDTEYFDIIDF